MIFAGFFLGLMMSFHCVGMCGPLALMIPVDRKSGIKASIQTLMYHLGRTATYTLIGVLFGLFGKGLYLSGMQQRLTIVMGVLMILSAFVSLGGSGINSLASPFSKFLSEVKLKLGLLLGKKNPKTIFFIGVLNGFLPCGLVYTAVFGAVAMGSAFEGGLYMFLFGLGTMPFMTLTIFLGNFLKSSQAKYIQKAFPIFVLAVGILFVLRGLGLGIPYISPSDAALQITNNAMSCPAVLN
ncbi:MAG: sulfite exporter TauE/SafE family protein [Flavobacteriaceae bacterium]